MMKRIVRFLRIVFAFFGILLVLFFILNFIFPLKVRINYSHIVTASDGSIIHAFLSTDEKWRMLTDKDEISPTLERAILFKEDRWFYYHPGVNPVSVVRAAFNNFRKSQRTSGASTITMQLARLLVPQNRTYANKLCEMFRSLQLELHYSKREILRMYLTLVPYGGNIEGIKAASYFYFGRLPDKLSLAQVAALTVIPNNPNALRPGVQNEKLFANRNNWLRKMEQAKLFSTSDIHDAIAEPLLASRQSAPSLAPQFALRMLHAFPDQPVIHTSLNKPNQQKVNSIAFNYSKRIQSMNINNCAVIVINNKSNCIEAYLGSADNSDVEHFGKVDGITSVRSPGSALKPLVYALAFEKGIVTPKTVLADVSVNFDGYSPENFNSMFNGNVTAEKALSNSLNIPAVKLLSQLGVATFTDRLGRASFKQIIKDVNKLGLSAVLGGCGVTLEELTLLYAAFAHEGAYSPIRWLNDSSASIRTELITPEATFMISDILSSLSRPDIPVNYKNGMHIPRIAWKTGTSYGRRDAWSIGYNRDYTIGVWVGNFSGEGVPELSGAEIATPLLFEIFNSIDYNASNQWYTQPENLDFRLVCSESGKVPDDFCENQVIDYFIRGISSNQKCAHLKKVFIDPAEKYSYCTACLPAIGYKTKLYLDLSQDILSYYNSKQMAYMKIPPHNIHCSRIFTSHPPVITSPTNNQEYIVSKNDDQKIQLSCNPDNEVKTLFWYINDRFYKSCAAGEVLFFNPGNGKIKVSCSDDKGRNSDIHILVNGAAF